MNKQELIKKYEKEYETIFGFPVIRLSLILEDLKQLDEPQKVKIPKFVAEWIEYCKKHNFTLFGCLDPVNGFESLADETFEGDIRKCIRWCRKESNNFARAWLDGYENEKEKRYLVKIKGNVSENILVFGLVTQVYFFSNDNRNNKYRQTTHTRKELERSGFGWVFNCPGVEVKEMKE